MQEELPSVLARALTGRGLPGESRPGDFVAAAPGSRDILWMRMPDEAIDPVTCRSIWRVLAEDGFLLLATSGGNIRTAARLRGAGFAHVHGYRFVARDRYLLPLSPPQPALCGGFCRRAAGLWAAQAALKTLQGRFLFVARKSGAAPQSMLLRANSRTVFAVLAPAGSASLPVYFKAARDHARADFPAKESLAIAWLRETAQGLALPRTTIEAGTPTLLRIDAVPGEAMRLTKPQMAAPDRNTLDLIRRARAQIERLSLAPPPADAATAAFMRAARVEAHQTRDRCFPGFGEPHGCIVHGDLNPANLLVDSSGVNIIDWEHWRIGFRFENWFDFLIRVTWQLVKPWRFLGARYILRSYRSYLRAAWIREETRVFFRNCGVAVDPDEALRYTLFLFLLDGILDLTPERLMRELTRISLRGGNEPAPAGAEGFS